MCTSMQVGRLHLRPRGADGRAGSGDRPAPRRTRRAPPGSGRGGPPTCRRSRRRPRASCRRRPSRTRARVTSGSRRFGMKALMPPIAKAPRLWHVLHEQLGVRPHERHGHRDLAAVGQHEPRTAAAVVLDDREDVVPAAGVQARAVVAQLEEDLLHLERGGQRLDEHGRADRAVRDADVLLAEGEDVVPQLRLFARLELGDVEVRAAAVRDQLLRRCGRSTGRSRRANPTPPWCGRCGR